MNKNLPDLLARLRVVLGARVVTDAERRRRYEVPERGEPGHTPAVLLPQSDDEVAAVLKLCNEAGSSVVVSSGRTGLVEAQRPDGELVLSLEKLSQPLRFELADGRVHVFDPTLNAEAQADALAQWWRGLGQPHLSGATITVQGGISVDAVSALLEPLQLMWPMEMGSTSSASVGACVANASAGANAVCYGTAAQLCVAAWGYWGDGSAAGPCHAPEWKPVPPDQLAIDSAGFDPAQGLIGTQGVLGVITRAQLRTYALPAQREAVLLPVAAMPEAMRVLAAAREAFPGDVEEFEFIGRKAIELVRLHQGEAFRWSLPGEPDAPYYLLLQVTSRDAQDDLAGRLYAFLAESLQWPEDRIGYAPLPVLKKIRHSITESSNARMRALGGGRLSFDTATPVAVFGDYLAAVEKELHAASTDLEFVAFGHAGVGGAHLHLIGTREHPVARRSAELIGIVFDVTQRYGGTFSAEHGVGPKWGGEFQRRAAPAVREALRAAKVRHDPHRVLNPRSFAIPRS